MPSSAVRPPRFEPIRLGDDPTAAGRATAWRTLDRLVEALGDAGRGPTPAPRVLEAVREAVAADLAFFHPNPEGAGLVGDPAGLPLDWYQAFAWELLSREPAESDRVLLPDLRGPDPLPGSAAMLRMSRSRPVWLVAVNRAGRPPLGPADLEAMAVARRLVANQGRVALARERLGDAVLELVRGVTTAVDARDGYPAGHSERVGRLASRLGRRLGFGPAEAGDLYLAGLLHDVGKLAVGEAVLRKPGPLTHEEFEQAKRHVLAGPEILGGVGQLRGLIPAIRSHHERFDGRGYPDGLAGADIPPMARVVAVAEACDAMQTGRLYRPALPPDRVERTLAEGSGSRWDPDVVACLLDGRGELLGRDLP